MTTGDQGTAGWEELEAELVDAVTGLADGGSLVVAGPPTSVRLARPRGAGWMRWFVPPKRRPMLPSVRLVRVEDHLRGHWVGAERFGGSFPWTAEEDAAITALGWHRPAGADGEDYVRFWPDDVPQGPYLPREDAERAAAAVVRTFRELLGPQAEDEAGSAPALPVIRR